MTSNGRIRLKEKRTNPQVVAVLCADLHLCHKPPVARSAEPIWYDAMLRQLNELSILAMVRQGTTLLHLPVIIAGDILDRWNSPSELVNFALTYLPEGVYAVPGQHDLADHRYTDRHRTSFQTLVEAGKITLLRPGTPVEVPGLVPLRLHGFPWGFKPTPCPDPQDVALEIAVIHRYVWVGNKGYATAPETGKLGRLKKRLRGYDVAVFGDNHTPFSCKLGTTQVWNCGGFYRRKADEIGSKPSVGLLYADGHIERKYLDVSRDKFLPPADLKQLARHGVEIEGFLNELANLSDTAISFQEAMQRFLEGSRTPPAVRQLLVQAMEEV